MEKITKEKEWYDNANFVTTIIIGLIFIIIIMSQAFAVRNNIGVVNTVRSLFNHNTIYVIALIYFLLIKTNVGKKYFNIINIIYIALYLLLLLASFLTIFQSFGITSLASLLLNMIMLFYMVYTFLYDTRLWNDFKLNLIPFDEIKNEWYFNSICTLSILVLIVNLIGASNFEGVVLSLFDTIYTCLFARYIYLYKEYENNKKKVVNKKGGKNER